MSWTVVNAGTGTTPGSIWYDHVFLSQDPTLDALDAPLGQFQHTGALDAGRNYTRNLPITLPDGIGGIYYLLVKADGGLGIAEGTAEDNNVLARPIHVDLAPYPDLVVTQIDAPTTVQVGDPAQFTLSWTVRNQGTGPGITSSWVDRVVLSQDAVLGNSDDRIVGNYAESGVIDPGQERSVARALQLPGGLLGAYYLYVIVDAQDEVFELGGEQNNARRTDQPVLVTPRLYADLVARVDSAPTAATAGGTISVTWTVTNQGIGNPNVFGWNDRLILSARYGRGQRRRPGHGPVLPRRPNRRGG